MAKSIKSFIDINENALLLVIGIIIVSAGQLLLKRGVFDVDIQPSIEILSNILKSPYLILGISLYGLGSILWLFVLKRMPLSVAYPSMSISYIIVFFASGILFTETLGFTKILGVALIFLGVSIINRKEKTR